MLCKRCGSELREGALFCVKCGAKIEPEVSSQPVVPQNDNVCTNCGTSLQAGAKFCISCGMPVLNAQPVTEPLKRNAVPIVNVPNPTIVSPDTANPSVPVPIQEQTFQFTYLGGGRIFSLVTGNPLSVTLKQDQLIMKAETNTGFLFVEIPYNEIVSFEMKRTISVSILLFGAFLLVIGVIAALAESIYGAICIILGVVFFICGFPIILKYKVADGRKFSFYLKKPKSEKNTLSNSFSALMNQIIQTTPKMTNITKQQSQIKIYKG